MRRLLCIFLLMCLPLQSFAALGVALFAGADANLAHQVAHDEQLQHHHHDDSGSVHFDDSDESAKHIQDHPTSSQPVFLAAVTMPVAPEQVSSLEQGEFARFIPEPFLDGPLRPPSFALGLAAGGRLPQ